MSESVSFNKNDLFGTILIGTWVGSYLAMLIFKEVIFYFRNFPRDSFSFKGFIAMCIVIDFGSLVGGYADVYLNLVTHWGDVTFITKQYWPMILCLATTGTTTALIQSFLTYRLYTLTRNWLICSVLAIMIFTSFGAGEATAIMYAMFPNYTERSKSRIPVIIWLIVTMVTDITISASLIYQLSKMKTSFKQTESLIHRLMRTSMQTGLATCFMAIVTLIAFLVDETSNVETMLAFILGRVYILTLFSNINLRKGASSKNYTYTSEDDRPTAARVNPSAMNLDGIHVHRSAMVHMDDNVLPTAVTVSYGKTQPRSDAQSAKGSEVSLADNDSVLGKKSRDLDL